MAARCAVATERAEGREEFWRVIEQRLSTFPIGRGCQGQNNQDRYPCYQAKEETANAHFLEVGTNKVFVHGKVIVMLAT